MRTGNGSDKSTQALVEDTIAGNTEAFARLVDRYRDAASAVAYSYFGGFDDVQDAVQEAFVHAYCNIRQLKDPAKFGPWLRRITANSCAMALRKRERANVSLDEVAEQASTSDDAGKIAAREIVQEALAKLSDATRLTVTLSYIDGYSHAEVAEFLEVPLTTVRSRLRHAKRKLREEMLDYGRAMFWAKASPMASSPSEWWIRQCARPRSAKARYTTADAIAALGRGTGGD